MISEIFSGFSAYGRAFSLMSEHKLWKYALLPGLLSIIAIVGLIALPSWGFISGGPSDAIMNAYPYEFGRGAMETAMNILVVLVLMIALFLGGKYIALVIMAPFMSPVSDKVEEILTGSKPNGSSNFLRDLIRGIRLAIRNFIREILLTIFFLLFNLVPVVGSFVGAALTFLTQAYFAGFGNMDYTLERKQFKLRQSVAFVSANRYTAIGNGIPFLLIFLIPVFGWVLAPLLGTIAATESSLSLMKREGVA